MRSRAARFEVDRAQGKLLGVCAGIAQRTAVDVTIIRIAVVLAALVTSFTAVVILYFGAALVGSRGHRAGSSRRQVDDGVSAERIRDHEVRMREVETYVAGSNSRLAREIEELR